MAGVVRMATSDLRFPTSRELDGSDAMNPDPDYSAAYVTLGTAAGEEGHGFVFTIGRGNDVVCAALEALRPHVLALDMDAALADMGSVWRRLVHDSQLRWLGPEKGVMHMAIGAVVNALWDLAARRAGQPLWRLLAGMSPEALVDLVDFRYLTDALTREEALDLLRRAEPGRAAREEDLLRVGYPAYTTSPGWLGYDDAKLQRLCRQAAADGFRLVKLKVGADLEDDVRRLRLAREALGPDVAVAVDANQRWDVREAIEWVTALGDDLAWVEEPTSPDDVLGHAAIAAAVAPVPVATGEQCANRVMFKQLLQARGLSVLQLDATRVAGVNENLAVLLLAAKFGVPVCPHAGGVGLCEAVQHLAMFDYVAVSGTLEGRMIEYVDHLHEHFVTPVEVVAGRYRAPVAPGAGTEMLAASRSRYAYPHGPVWSGQTPVDVTA